MRVTAAYIADRTLTRTSQCRCVRSTSLTQPITADRIIWIEDFSRTRSPAIEQTSRRWDGDKERISGEVIFWAWGNRYLAVCV
jgi:hypothetical protein